MVRENLAYRTIRLATRLFTLTAFLLSSFPEPMVSVAQQPDENWNEVRTIDIAELAQASPVGMSYIPDSGLFLIWDVNGNVTGITMREEVVTVQGMKTTAQGVQNVTFDPKTNSLLVLQEATSSLERIGLVGTTSFVSVVGAPARIDVNSLGLQNVKGMAFDPAGRLFLLDANGTQVVAVTHNPEIDFDWESAALDARIMRFNLRELGHGAFQGIAFNPNNKHFFSFNPGEQTLYEFTENSQMVSTYDLSSLNLVNPKTLLFAPSGDATDDPAEMNLFILDSEQMTISKPIPGNEHPVLSNGSIKNDLIAPIQVDGTGGRLVEVSFESPVLISTSSLLPTTLIRTIDTSKYAWDPSSPDPAGIAYWSQRGTLLIADSEVDEMPIYFTGDNIFESSLEGNLLNTCGTTDANDNEWSDEPTGVAINSNNNHIFFSDDDDGGQLHEVDLGLDGIYCTFDDTVTTVRAPGDGDAEGIAYGANQLFIAGGTDREVYMFDLGKDGLMG